MPYKNCLIPTCSSRGNNKLYRFPTDNCLADAWHDILICKYPEIKISGCKRISQRICELHFENIYKKFGRRIVNAVPTLFTQEEIRGFDEQNPYPELKAAITGKKSVETKNCTVKSFAPMGVGHDHGYYARTKRIKICFDGCERTAEDPQERRWVPRCRQEAPKASDGTLIGDKGTGDNNDVALLRMGITLQPASSDKEESWCAEDQMDGIETVAVADDVPTPAPPEFSWQRPPEAIPCADDVEIQTDVSPTGGDGGDDRRPIESYNDRLHLGYNCNECGSGIVGYRYTCVQCCDVELCGACEASGAHPEHYVLRLPRPEPAGAVKDLLETLRGLLDHLPLQELHQVKKEEIDDADPLSFGFVPLEPVNEDDDSEFELYEENEEPTKEATPPLDDNMSLTDLRPVNVDFTSNTPTDTANIQHPANENSPDKVCLGVGNRSSRKVLLRLKKVSEVNDDSAVQCSVVRPCEGEIEVKSGARAASGASVTKLMTGVAKSGPRVTTVRTGVTTSGAGVTTVRTGVTTSGAGVTTSGAGVTTVRTGVTTSGAGVSMLGPSVTSAGAGSRVSGAPVVIPVVKLARMDDRLLRGEGTWTLIP